MLCVKALSVRQPWATLIVLGVKNIENRTWATAYRGKLAIHASTVRDGAEIKRWQAILASDGIDVADSDFPVGGIIGTVEVVDCVAEHNSEWFGGPWGWVLANPEPLDFVRFRGRLGLFDVDI